MPIGLELMLDLSKDRGAGTYCNVMGGERSTITAR